MQRDLFAGESLAVRSFPPHLDPARRVSFTIDQERDGDHVAAAVNGVLPVGAVGRSPDVFVLRVLEEPSGANLFAQTFTTWRAASVRLDEIRIARAQNAQAQLF